MVGFVISGVEPSGSATTVLVRWILVRQVVRMGVDGTGSGSYPMIGFFSAVLNFRVLLSWK
jgi:C4-dicarboxylate transporter